MLTLSLFDNVNYLYDGGRTEIVLRLFDTINFLFDGEFVPVPQSLNDSLLFLDNIAIYAALPILPLDSFVIWQDNIDFTITVFVQVLGILLVPQISDSLGISDNMGLFLKAPPVDASLEPFYAFVHAYPQWVLSFGGAPDKYLLTYGLYTGSYTYAFNPDIQIQSYGDPPVPIRQFVPGIVVDFFVSSIREAYFDGRYLNFTYAGHYFVCDGVKNTSTIS